MTQRPVSRKSTCPRRVLNLLFITGVLLNALTVELCRRYLAPFDGLASEASSIRGALRFGFVLIGLVGVGVIPIILWRSSIVGSVEAHIFACALLELPAVYGSVLFFMGGHRFDFYGFAVPALVGLLLLWTQAGRWDRLSALEQHDREMTGE